MINGVTAGGLYARLLPRPAAGRVQAFDPLGDVPVPPGVALIHTAALVPPQRVMVRPPERASIPSSAFWDGLWITAPFRSAARQATNGAGWRAMAGVALHRGSVQLEV